VANDKSIMERFEDGIERIPFSGCWIWTKCCFTQGYGCIRIDYKNIKVHRLSWELHFGPIPEGVDVLHMCDVMPCVSPHHLFLGNNSDNMRDMAEKGRSLAGSKHPNSKLNEEKVREIFSLYEKGFTKAKIARMFGVTHGSIAHIIKNRAWKHVKLENFSLDAPICSPGSDADQVESRER
jgi:hypothetical protein